MAPEHRLVRQICMVENRLLGVSDVGTRVHPAVSIQVRGVSALVLVGTDANNVRPVAQHRYEVILPTMNNGLLIATAFHCVMWPLSIRTWQHYCDNTSQGRGEITLEQLAKLRSTIQRLLRGRR